MNVEHLWKTYGLTANLKRKKETSRGEIMKKKGLPHTGHTCDVNLLRWWWRSRKQQLQGKIKADKH